MGVSNLFFNKKSNSPTLIIDANLLGCQAFYSTGYLSYNGKETGVVFGFLKNILSLGKNFNTKKFIFCWDSSKSYRKKAFPDYKKNRSKKKEKTPEDKAAFKSLTRQMGELKNKVLPELGFYNNFLLHGFEGDDLLAWWASRANGKKIMVTTDADMYQCLNDCDIWNPRKKRLFTKDNLIKEFGIAPEQWGMAKAIGGCSGDEVPGIVGVSDPKNPKSKSLKFLQGKLSKGATLNKIESKEGQRIIKRNLPLVSLPYCDGNHSVSRMIKRRDKFNRENFLMTFDILRFKSFLESKNFMEWRKIFL